MTARTILGILGVALAVQCALGCAALLMRYDQPAVPVTDMRRYFPLVEGGEWVYDLYRQEGERVSSSTVRHSQVKEAEFGVVTALIETATLLLFTVPETDRQQVTYRYNNEGITATSKNLLFPESEEILTLPSLRGPLVPGTSWTTGSDEEYSWNIRFEIVGFETLETRNGKYDNALKVLANLSMKRESSKYRTHIRAVDWIVADIGTVRSLRTETEGPNSERTELVLRSFRVVSP